MRILLSLALRFLPYILALVAATSAMGYAGYRLTHWCNKVCVIQTTRADKAEAKVADLDRQRIAQVERAEQERYAQDKRDAERAATAKRQFVALVKRAEAAEGRLHDFSAGTSSLFNDIAAAASGTAPSVSNGAGAVPQAAEAYDEGELKAWIVAIGEAFSKLDGQKQSCINRYNSLRESQ